MRIQYRPTLVSSIQSRSAPLELLKNSRTGSEWLCYNARRSLPVRLKIGLKSPSGQHRRSLPVQSFTVSLWWSLPVFMVEKSWPVRTDERHSSNTHPPFFTVFFIFLLTLATLLRTGSGGTIHPLCCTGSGCTVSSGSSSIKGIAGNCSITLVCSCSNSYSSVLTHR